MNRLKIKHNIDLWRLVAIGWAAAAYTVCLAGEDASGVQTKTSSDSASVNREQDILSDDTISNELLLFENIPIVITAAKYEQPISRAPATVTCITGDDIRNYGYRTLNDALQSVPGFYMYYDRVYHYAGVRGFGRPGDYNSRILILIDNHSLNENVGDSGFIGTEFPVNVDLIERIEVIKGPGSSLYGGNAIFAVVNIITKKGQKIDGVELSGEAGSYDTYKGRLTYGSLWNDDLEVMLSTSGLKSNGQELYHAGYDAFETNDGYDHNDDQNFYDLFAKVRWKELTFEAASVSREKGVPGAPWETVFGDKRTRMWDDTTFLGLSHQHTFSEDLSINTRLGYHHYNYDGRWPYEWAEEGEPSYVVENKDLWRGRWWEAEMQFFATPFEKHKLIWGFQGRYNVAQNQKNWDEEIYLDDKRHSKSWGLFLQDEVEIRDNLRCNAGVRYDRFDTVGDTINPRVAMIYDPRPGTTLKLIYGTAFRAPNMYEMYYGDGLTMKANPSVQPEEIRIYEASLEQKLTAELRTTAGVYYYKLDKVIGSVFDPEDEMTVFENLGAVKGKGIELGLDGAWKNGLKGRLSYAYTDARDQDTGKHLTNSPRHLAKGNLTLPLYRDQLFAGIEILYTSKAETLIGTNADDSLITNLTLTCLHLAKGLDLSFSIYNLFDVKAEYPASSEFLEDTLEQDGLNFRVKLTWHF